MDENRVPHRSGGDGGSGKTEAREKNRTRMRRIRWIVIAVAAVIVVYFIIQVVIVLMPRMRTQVAILESMTDSIDVTGFVCMESTPVQGAEVSLYYLVPAGQRVSAGTDIALVFPSADAAEKMVQLDSVNAELALLQEAKSASEDGDVEALLRQMESGVYDYLTTLTSGSYGDLYAARQQVMLAANKMKVTTGEAGGFDEREAALNAKKAQLEAEAVATGSLTAGQSGYFVPSSKYDHVAKTAAELAELPPDQLADLCEQPLASHDASVAGHIIADYKWQFYTTVTAKQAEKLSAGMRLELSFPEKSDETVPVRVESVTAGEEGGLVKVVFSCEHMNSDIMKLRLENAKIIFNTLKGLRIDKGALRVIEGEQCVYVKFGNQVYLRKVEVLLEDENYLLLSQKYEEEVNEIRLYDEVVVDAGGMELYDKLIL